MKILTCSIYSAGHGAFERQRRMARALINAGHEVLWLAPGLDYPDREKVIPVVRRSKLPGPLGWVADLRRTIDAAVRDASGVDAVYIVNDYDALACVTAPALRDTPVVFFLRGDTVEIERFHTVHALSHARRLKSRLLGLYYPVMQGFLMGRLARAVVQTPFLADILRRRHATLPPIDVLPNDTSIDWHAETTSGAQIDAVRALKKNGGFLIGLVAQVFWKGKGFDVFLDAMAALKDDPRFHAVIVGYGPEQDLLEPTVARLGLQDRVTWLGRSGAAHALMPLFDALAVPTVFLDACPNVVLEGLESEIPIVASDIPAHRAQLDFPDLMVPTGDALALASALRALAVDPATRARNLEMVRARKTALAFDWDARVVDIVETTARAEAD